MKPEKIKNFKSILGLILMCIIVLGAGLFTGTPVAQAKTDFSAAPVNVFFYLLNKNGENVLLDVMPIEELRENLSHGQLSNVTYGADTGVNYYFSCTDNMPNPRYTEARGFTIPELVDYVKKNSEVAGIENISYAGDDRIVMIATDSGGSYNTGRIWSYNELYGVPRYYFPGIFPNVFISASSDTECWNGAWEIYTTDADSGIKYGPSNQETRMPLDYYMTVYQGEQKDPYYDKKRQVFENGELTTVIFATDVVMPRVSREEGAVSLREHIEQNGYQVTGSYREDLIDTGDGDYPGEDRAIQLSIPQSEAELMAGTRTAYDCFAWTFNIQLRMDNRPDIRPLGTVAKPVVNFTQEGDKLIIDFECATPGAKIYYSVENDHKYGKDESLRNLYDGEPLVYDVSQMDLSTEAITIWVAAVKEGYADAGMDRFLYPKQITALSYLPMAVGSNLSFRSNNATSELWEDWCNSLTGIYIKYPGDVLEMPISLDKVTFNNSYLTLDKSLFTNSGRHTIRFVANGYGNQTITVQMAKPVPVIRTGIYHMNSDIALSFADNDYQTSVSVGVKETDSTSLARTINATYLDRSQAGKLTITSSYFDEPNCVIKAPGQYELTLTHNSYTPSRQTITIRVLEEGAELSGRGDVDNNGVIDAEDVSSIYSYVRGSGSSDDAEVMERADFNGDGEVNILDVLGTNYYGVLGNE